MLRADATCMKTLAFPAVRGAAFLAGGVVTVALALATFVLISGHVLYGLRFTLLFFGVDFTRLD